MRKEDWIQILSTFDPPLTENLSNVIGYDLPENDIITSKMITFANVLNQSIRDAETYRMIPSELRLFLESNSEAMYALGRRLTEAVNARDQVTVIRDYIDMAKSNSEKKCAKCELMEIIEAIETIVNSSFLDTSV
ncbi:MAG: hypothetical protein ABIJ47_11775 [Candidatus Bathyarchaeota archaeon]